MVDHRDVARLDSSVSYTLSALQSLQASYSQLSTTVFAPFGQTVADWVGIEPRGTYIHLALTFLGNALTYTAPIYAKLADIVDSQMIEFLRFTKASSVDVMRPIIDKTLRNFPLQLLNNSISANVPTTEPIKMMSGSIEESYMQASTHVQEELDDESAEEKQILPESGLKTQSESQSGNRYISQVHGTIQSWDANKKMWSVLMLRQLHSFAAAAAAEVSIFSLSQLHRVTLIHVFSIEKLFPSGN